MINNKLRLFGAYSVLFAIAFIIIFFDVIKLGSFVFEGDAKLQLYPAMNYISEHLKTLNFNQFEPNVHFGSDTIAIFKYYVLGDVYMLLTAFFNSENMHICFNIIFFLKLYSLGIAFILFAKRHIQNNISLLIGALTYSLSLYALKMTWELMFINAAIFLPLALIGVDKIFESSSLKEFANSLPFLFIPLFFSNLSADLLNLQVVLFVLIYFAILVYIRISKHPLKELLKKMLAVLFSIAISFGLSAFLFLPANISLINSPRVGMHYVPTFYSVPFLIKELFSSVAAFGGDVEDIFAVSPVLLLSVIIIFSKVYKSDSKAKALRIGYILLTFALITPFFAFIMSGFQAPKNRYLYVFTLICSVLIAYTSENIKKVNLKAAVLVLIVSTIMLFISKLAVFANSVLVLSILALIILIFIFRVNRFDDYKFQYFLLGFTVVVVIISGRLLLIQNFAKSSPPFDLEFVSSAKLENFRKGSADFALSDEPRNELGQIRYATDLTATDINANIFNNNFTTSQYFNNPFPNSMKFRSSLSLFSHYGMPWNNYDKEPRIGAESLLGINYIVSQNSQMDNFDEYKRTDKYYVYKNNSALPLAFLTNNSTEELASLNTFEKEERMFCQISKCSKSSEVKPYFVINSASFEPTVYQSKSFSKYFGDVSPYPDKFAGGKIIIYNSSKKLNELQIMSKHGEYSYDANNLTISLGESVNPNSNEQVKNNMYNFEITKQDGARFEDNSVITDKANASLEIKDSQIGNELIIYFTNPGRYSFKEFGFQFENITAVKQATILANENKVNSFTKNKDSFEIKFNYSKVKDLNQIDLLLPNSQQKFLGINKSAWKAKVDGREIEVKNNFIAFIAINLESLNLEDSEHTLTLEYSTPFFFESKLISVFSLLILLVFYLSVLFISRRRNAS